MKSSTSQSRRKSRRARRNIEKTVIRAAQWQTVFDKFSIPDIRHHLKISRNLSYSYKQVRNALYRVRCKSGTFEHLARGMYQWL